jgi:hypothetical protein
LCSADIRVTQPRLALGSEPTSVATAGAASTRCMLLCETPVSLATSSSLWPARRST